MPSPPQILNAALQRASAHIAEPIVDDPGIRARVTFVCRNKSNRAGARFLMACLLAKTHDPAVDIRKPYTEIGGPDSYSGRTYDEQYISGFITEHDLPCNVTTAFLTPAFRTINTTLTTDLVIEGRPRELYQRTLQLLGDVHTNTVSAEDLLVEMIRCLLIYRDERRQRMETLLERLKASEGAVPLSAEGIVTLIEQHLSCPRSSRLPVLLVASAYQAAEKHLGERVLPLEGHTTADKQTGALGDLQITLIDDDGVITS